MAKVFSEKAIAILTDLREHDGEPRTANDIAQALDVNPRSVNGSITALSRKGLVERIEVEGIDKKVIVLTAAGREADLEAEKEE